MFHENDLAVIIRPYGYARVKGFFLLAIHPRDIGLIQEQLSNLAPDVREDVGSLFSWISHADRHRGPRASQLEFSLVDANGKELDMGRMQPRFGVKPFIEIDQDQVSMDELFPDDTENT